MACGAISGRAVRGRGWMLLLVFFGLLLDRCMFGAGVLWRGGEGVRGGLVGGGGGREGLLFHWYVGGARARMGG